MNSRARYFLASGAILFAVSAYPLALMAREWCAARQLAATFKLEPSYDTTSLAVGTHRIEVSDRFASGNFKPEDRQIAPVKISIDGRDNSDPSLIEIRPHYHDANRYHGWLVLARLTDKKQNKEWLAIGERTLGDTLLVNRRALQPTTEFRLLLVSADGQISEERFSLGERAKPLYRAAIVNYLYPQPAGFHSQILAYWPSLFFPILYPLISGAVGLLLMAAGFGGRRFGAK